MVFRIGDSLATKLGGHRITPSYFGIVDSLLCNAGTAQSTALYKTAFSIGASRMAKLPAQRGMESVSDCTLCDRFPENLPDSYEC